MRIDISRNLETGTCECFTIRPGHDLAVYSIQPDVFCRLKGRAMKKTVLDGIESFDSIHIKKEEFEDIPKVFKFFL